MLIFFFVVCLWLRLYEGRNEYMKDIREGGVDAWQATYEPDPFSDRPASTMRRKIVPPYLKSLLSPSPTSLPTPSLPFLACLSPAKYYVIRCHPVSSLKNQCNSRIPGPTPLPFSRQKALPHKDWILSSTPLFQFLVICVCRVYVNTWICLSTSSSPKLWVARPAISETSCITDL